MLKVQKLVFCCLIPFIMSACLASGAAREDDIYYSVRARGDDALTMSLINSLEKQSDGYRYVSIDKVSEDTLVIFVKTNLTFSRRRSDDYAGFEVDILKGARVVSSVRGECLSSKINICRDKILGRLRIVLRKSSAP